MVGEKYPRFENRYQSPAAVNVSHAIHAKLKAIQKEKQGTATAKSPCTSCGAAAPVRITMKSVADEIIKLGLEQYEHLKQERTEAATRKTTRRSRSGNQSRRKGTKGSSKR